MARLTLLCFVVLAACVGAMTLRGRNATTAPSNATSTGEMTFTGYYATVKEGRGIWKWNNALVAYDRHFIKFQGKKPQGAEVGVQSGGSLVMWHQVLGEGASIHGLDINPRCTAFADKETTITLGDQESPKMWESFFADITPNLDFLVDDGGHFPMQMLETSYSVWPKLNKGGILVIEDIHGAHYLDSFFKPAAQFLGTQRDVKGVHLYAYMLLAEKTGDKSPAYDPSTLEGANIPEGNRVSTYEAMQAKVWDAPAGSLVVLENADWGNFIQPDGLTNFFTEFINLYAPSAMPDTPVGCADSPAAVCTYGTTNSALMNRVSGVHILPSKLVVEIPAQPPVIEAVRHGLEWVKTPKDDEIPEEVKTMLSGKGEKHALHYTAKP